MGSKWPSVKNVWKFFYGSEYENNFDAKFWYNLCARCAFLLFFFHPPVTIILGPPKHQKFRNYSWFCHNDGKFVNSQWRYQIQLSLVRKTIVLTHVWHQTQIMNFLRKKKHIQISDNRENSNKKTEKMTNNCK